MAEKLGKIYHMGLLNALLRYNSIVGASRRFLGQARTSSWYGLRIGFSSIIVITLSLLLSLYLMIVMSLTREILKALYFDGMYESNYLKTLLGSR